MVCLAPPTRTPASSSSSRIGFFASSRVPKPRARSAGTQVVMCDSGPSRWSAPAPPSAPGRRQAAQRLRHRRGADRADLQHAHGGVQARADHVFQQAGETGGLGRGAAARSRAPGRRGQRPRAAAGRAVDQAFARERSSARRTVTRATPNCRIRASSGQSLGEAALVQLLAQHQVDLVVLGQGERLRHGCASSGRSIVLSMGHLMGQVVLPTAKRHCSPSAAGGHE